MDKIDIHCHILPHLDDGAKSAKDSFEMLKMAMEQEIKAVIATPHHSMQFPNENPKLIREFCRELESWVQKRWSKEFRIYSGQELLYVGDDLQKLQEGKLLTLAESRYVLVEFFPGVSYTSLYRSVRELVAAGYWPVIAHVERYATMREMDHVQELTDAGAYFQMNYARIGGKWYEDTTKWCRKMLTQQRIHFLGTDMHNITDRSPNTQDAVKWMTGHLDRDYLEDILCNNARKIIANTRI